MDTELLQALLDAWALLAEVSGDCFAAPSPAQRRLIRALLRAVQARVAIDAEAALLGAVNADLRRVLRCGGACCCA